MMRGADYETDRQTSIYVDAFENAHEAVDLVQPIRNQSDCRLWVNLSSSGCRCEGPFIPAVRK
jgi:hypothetical protein